MSSLLKMENLFEGIVFITANELYNFLQQGLDYPKLSDPNFLLLLDARGRECFNESHIVTARRSPKIEDGEVMLPYDSEVECKVNIVVYDSNTSMENSVDGEAIQCAETLWNMGSRNPVKILEGGYEVFSALYPFLRTQKTIFMPRELDEIKTYPNEVLPGHLYLGNRFHGNALYIQKDLKIAAHVNCCVEAGEIKYEPGEDLLHLPIEDNNDTDILCHFQDATSFIGHHISQGKPVLVYSDKGISRSAIIIMAYLMHRKTFSLQAAYDQLLECNWRVRPNRGFIHQLSQWEGNLYGDDMTDISDPKY